MSEEPDAPEPPSAGDPRTGPIAWRDDLERVRALVDAAEGRSPVPLLDDTGITAVLRDARRIAMIGASSREGRPSRNVFRTLVGAGYEVVPVNPREREIDGVAAYPDLRAAVDATGPVDIVDVFRRAELCVPHSVEAVEVGATCLWLQLGIVNVEAARIAHEAGLSVVMDRCTAIELRRLR